MAVIASALSLASALVLTAGSTSELHGIRIVNLLAAVGVFFGVLLAPTLRSLTAYDY